MIQLLPWNSMTHSCFLQYCSRTIIKKKHEEAVNQNKNTQLLSQFPVNSWNFRFLFPGRHVHRLLRWSVETGWRIILLPLYPQDTRLWSPFVVPVRAQGRVPGRGVFPRHKVRFCTPGHSELNGGCGCVNSRRHGYDRWRSSGHEWGSKHGRSGGNRRHQRG